MKANEQFFKETGVRDEQLHATIVKFGLQKDPDFVRLSKDNK